MKGGACLHAPPFGVSPVTSSQVGATTQPRRRGRADGPAW